MLAGIVFSHPENTLETGRTYGLSFGSRLIHHKISALKVRVMQRRNRLPRRFPALHFHEPEPPGMPGVPIRYHCRGLDRSMAREKIL